MIEETARDRINNIDVAPHIERYVGMITASLGLPYEQYVRLFDREFWGRANAHADIKALLEENTTVETEKRRALMREIRGTPTRSLFARANTLAELASLHARTYAGYGSARPTQPPPEPYKVDEQQARLAVTRFLWLLVEQKGLRERVPANALEALAIARLGETFGRVNAKVQAATTGRIHDDD